MKMTVYRAKTTFGSFRFEANLAEAAAPIVSLPDSGDDDTDSFSTPYQTADARHSERRAALLCLEYFGSEYWLDPSAERGGDLIDGMTKADYIESLLVSVEAES